MAQHNDTGKHGEQLAAMYLRQKGYEIIDENWVHGKAEVDLIALYNDQLVFIEVKTRSSVAFGMPEDFVTPAKQRLMETAANAYIEIMDFDGELRFDIIAITMQAEGTYTIKHIEDAFWPFN